VKRRKNVVRKFGADGIELDQGTVFSLFLSYTVGENIIATIKM
jgi:hypothetical protein